MSEYTHPYSANPQRLPPSEQPWIYTASKSPALQYPSTSRVNTYNPNFSRSDTSSRTPTASIYSTAGQTYKPDSLANYPASKRLKSDQVERNFLNHHSNSHYPAHSTASLSFNNDYKTVSSNYVPPPQYDRAYYTQPTSYRQKYEIMYNGSYSSQIASQIYQPSLYYQHSQHYQGCAQPFPASLSSQHYQHLPQSPRQSAYKYPASLYGSTRNTKIYPTPIPVQSYVPSSHQKSHIKRNHLPPKSGCGFSIDSLLSSNPNKLVYPPPQRSRGRPRANSNASDPDYYGQSESSPILYSDKAHFSSYKTRKTRRKPNRYTPKPPKRSTRSEIYDHMHQNHAHILNAESDGRSRRIPRSDNRGNNDNYMDSEVVPVVKKKFEFDPARAAEIPEIITSVTYTEPVISSDVTLVSATRQVLDAQSELRTRKVVSENWTADQVEGLKNGLRCFGKAFWFVARMINEDQSYQQQDRTDEGSAASLDEDDKPLLHRSSVLLSSIPNSVVSSLTNNRITSASEIASLSCKPAVKEEEYDDDGGDKPLKPPTVTDKKNQTPLVISAKTCADAIEYFYMFKHEIYERNNSTKRLSYQSKNRIKEAQKVRDESGGSEAVAKQRNQEYQLFLDNIGGDIDDEGEEVKMEDAEEENSAEDAGEVDSSEEETKIEEEQVIDEEIIGEVMNVGGKKLEINKSLEDGETLEAENNLIKVR